MVVTVATVKFHLRSIRAKLGTKTRTETVAIALQLHLL
jgi:DNA-binding CsgD family transcriptional regulator